MVVMVLAKAVDMEVAVVLAVELEQAADMVLEWVLV